jgi:hypothetical protein
MTDDPIQDIANTTPAVIRWLISGQLRHLMVAAGTYMLAKGVLPSNTAEQAFVNWGVNGGLILVGLIWSFMNEKAKVSTTQTEQGDTN